MTVNRSMAKHPVATLNTKVTSERGAIRLSFSLVCHCLDGSSGAGGVDKRGRGALINLAKIYFAKLPKRPEVALKYEFAFILIPYPGYNSRTCFGLFA